jgi:protein arginine kinase activator
MKCQRCTKQATLHITEVLPESKFEEFHFCEECAKKYLYPAAENSKKKATANKSSSEDPGGKVCEACGIKFVEFRNSGRLGCPHDYDEFEAELVPLLESIHGELKHAGKIPHRSLGGREGLKELNQLRRKLQDAIHRESYEEAARLRDTIRSLEDQ